MGFLSPRCAMILALAGAAVWPTGCEQPSRVVTFPEGALRVRYEPATTYSTCLVSSVAMAANYLLDDRVLTEDRIRNDMKRIGLDETRIGDLQAYLADTRAGLCLSLRVLSGQFSDDPPRGLGYWVKQRGYPVICVINRDSQAPAFNHAVVVIGICPNPQSGLADIVHYLDPSSVEPLHSTDADAFELLWSRCRHAMMLVVRTPPERRGPDKEIR